MILVIVQYANGATREVLFPDTPRRGERIMLANGVDGAPYVVERVLWMEAREGEPEPSVIVSVRRELE